MMKIFATAPLFVLLSIFGIGGAAWATCNSPVSLSYEGTQKPDHDEFLYASKYEYDLSVQGYKNSGNKNSGDGHGYECDEYNSGSCNMGEVSAMPAGHVFKGEVINEARRYQCSTGWLGDDMWVVVNDSSCNLPGFGKIAAGQCVTENGRCKTLTNIDCSGYNKTDVNGIEFNGMCREGGQFICHATKCRDGMTANAEGKCIIGTSTGGAEKSQDQKDCEAAAARGEPANWNGNACNCGDKHTWNPTQKKCIAKATGGNGSGTTSSCISNRCKNLTGAQKAECAVCCAVPASVAKWDGAACKCVDTSKKFDVATGACNAQDVTPPTVVVPDPVVTFNCDATKLAQLAKWRVQYRAQTEIVALIDIILAYCQDANRNEIVFNSYYSELLALIAQADADAGAADAAQQQQTKINISIRRIRNSASSINNMANEFDVSKWKNAEGNFNTSRLVSDSVAGVVLGTAGGLITSNVIKKNQVKGGFEDISCTIGGQVVAGWKDEFQVGIR
ncbi:MAG: hypothetical protein K2L94_01420 [Alphaproteobacteria bacterium]|nr:hypothetical protein [Alphaproteobacteria bacterium]